MAEAKTNPMIAALADGKVLIGTWINMIRNPAVFTALKQAGLDYVRVDMEHASPSIETIADMALLSHALEFPMIVRPPGGSREWITRLLDAGVWGLHVPGVESAEEAEFIAHEAHYAPVGMRGMYGLGPHNDFVNGTPLAFMNAQVHVTVMLESAQAFAHLDEILSVPGIDAVTLGPTDLAQNLGVFGTPDQGRVIDEHREQLIDAAKRHGKDVAMLCNTVAEARRWIDAGVKIMALSNDVDVLQRAYAQMVGELR